MNDDTKQTEWDTFEPERARLRSLVSDVDREFSAMFAAEGAPAAPRLLDAWKQLVARLDLGTAPDMRRCPFCRRSVPAIATRCRYCMKSSSAESPSRAA
jgi:hypothetical protein